MIEVQMAENYYVDIFVRQSPLCQRVEQHVLGLHDAVAFSLLGGKERTDTRLEQDIASAVFNQQGPTGQGDTVQLVRLVPSAPQSARGVAKQRAAVQTLAVPHHLGGVHG